MEAKLFCIKKRGNVIVAMRNQWKVNVNIGMEERVEP